MSRTAEDKRYRRRLIINAAVLFVVSCTLALTLLFLPAEDYFQFYLNQADRALGRQDYPELQDQLSRATRYAKSREQWFSIFKRSYQAALGQDDFGDFQILVERSRRFLKGGSDHEALAIAAALWTGEYEKAAASLYTVQQERYKTLIAETLLSYDVYRNYDLEGMSPLEFIKEKIGYQEDPAFFESVGRKADNPILLYNAVLLSMEAGDYDRAASIVTGLPGSRISPYRLGVIFYDLGMKQRAYDALKAQSLMDDMKGNQRFSIHQMIGDLSMRAGRSDEALSEYGRAVNLKADGDWRNYRNISRLLYMTGYSRRAEAVLREGMDLFPGRIGLLDDYVSFFHEDDPIRVRTILGEYREDHPEDTAAVLLGIRYFPGKQSAVQYQASLWELFNRNDQNPEVARFLLWYLAGVGDIEGMEIVLQRYKTGSEIPYWYPFYQAVFEMNRGDIESAAEHLRQAYSLNPGWFVAYDLAVLESGRGNAERAETLLEEAYDDLERRSNLAGRSRFLSLISYEQALLLLDREDFKAAQGLLEKALDQDPANLRAGSLLNRIK